MQYSVVIPTYNRREKVQEAIDSVLAQRQVDLEIIVVDDGSNDGTAAALAQYGNSIRYRHQTNGGPAAARNLGIAMARGEWIAFLDSDDLWLPGKLRHEQAILQANPQLKMLVGNTESFVERRCRTQSVLDGRRVPFKEGKWWFDWSIEVVKEGPLCPLSATTIKRSTLNALGTMPFDSTLRFDEDWDLELRLFNHCQVLFYHQVFTRQRVFDDGTRKLYSIHGKPKSDDEWRRIWQIKKAIIARYLNHPSWDNATKQAFMAHYNALCERLDDNLMLPEIPLLQS